MKNLLFLLVCVTSVRHLAIIGPKYGSPCFTIFEAHEELLICKNNTWHFGLMNDTEMPIVNNGDLMTKGIGVSEIKDKLNHLVQIALETQPEQVSYPNNIAELILNFFNKENLKSISGVDFTEYDIDNSPICCNGFYLRNKKQLNTNKSVETLQRDNPAEAPPTFAPTLIKEPSSESFIKTGAPITSSSTPMTAKPLTSTQAFTNNPDSVRDMPLYSIACFLMPLVKLFLVLMKNHPKRVT